MKVTIKNILKNFDKNLDFLQPVFETIINSLQADAQNITITFLHDNKIDEIITPNISGFVIEDDGSGFTKINRDAFNELWTENKVQLGCKGSGRFTWLTVYKNITIESSIKETNETVIIPFSDSYDEEAMKISTGKEVTSNKTKIIFSNITDRYYSKNKKGEIKDKRTPADIEYLYTAIKDYLLITLFLTYKSQGKHFNIKIKVDDKEKDINASSIATLEHFDFRVPCYATPINGHDSYSFRAYYLFLNDKHKDFKMYLCSNNRPSKQIMPNEIGINGLLPNNDSTVLLVTSEYLDDKDSDDRSGLKKLSYLKNATSDYPILTSHIHKELKKSFGKIVKEKYKEIEKINSDATEAALKDSPHLAKQIKSNDDVIKSPESILSKAKITFNDAKEKTKEKFLEMLHKSNIETKEFEKSVAEISETAASELGEYVKFREVIIKALYNAITDNKKQESFYHNIIMPKRTTATGNDGIYTNNFWLLDDKFMHFSYASSDIEIDKIKKEIKSLFYTDDDKRRPDVAMFYNKPNGAEKTEAILIELKKPDADRNTKAISLHEIITNIGAIHDCIPSIKTFWAYVITTIDDKFKKDLEVEDGVIPLFTSNDPYRIYYKYSQKYNAHIFIQDLRSVISDAKDRNDIFLKILEEK